MAWFYRELKDQLLWKVHYVASRFSTFRMEWELCYVRMSTVEVKSFYKVENVLKLQRIYFR